ncbi:MAG: hypothetical protein FWG08_00015 [Propionibacteriaceae bacterium]|nr:hypothetical protein [Propionibacteriaceae bacterium]
MLSPLTTVEILVWLILATLLGYLIGWLIRGVRLRRRLAAVEAEERQWADEYEQLIRDLDDCRTQQTPIAPRRAPALSTWEDTTSSWEDTTPTWEDTSSTWEDTSSTWEETTWEEPVRSIAAPQPRYRDWEEHLAPPVRRSAPRRAQWDLDSTGPAWTPPPRQPRPQRPIRPRSTWATQQSDLDDAAIRRARAAARTRVERIRKEAGVTDEVEQDVVRPTRTTNARTKGSKVATPKTVATSAPKATATKTGEKSATKTSAKETSTAPKHRYSQAEGKQRVKAIAERTAGKGPVAKDDLRKIHGVGDVLSKLLKSMGITSFRQVANFTAEDVEAVEAALDCFPGRVTRDDWMSSAREEHEKKYGEKA